MSHESIRTWVSDITDLIKVDSSSVLELGSCSYIEESAVRPIFEKKQCGLYLGIDIDNGPRVDIVCDASYVINLFGEESFDIIVSTEMLEHVIDWKNMIHQTKTVCKRNGCVILTTRSKGYRYHPNPYDMWRYELDDMKAIFSDFEIIQLTRDWEIPGVCIIARKPDNFKETELAQLKLYSMLFHRRIAWIPSKHLAFYTRLGAIINELHKPKLLLLNLRTKEGRRKLVRYLKAWITGKRPKAGQTVRRLKQEWLGSRNQRD
ncbi:MAG: class I SAM-dependent methyltransferase [Nitrososphaerales archaeon]